MDAQLITLIDSFIPGDIDLGAPKCSVVVWPQLQEERDFLARIDDVINDYNKVPGCAFSENIGGDEIALKAFSSFFMEKHKELYVEFREIIMGLYFSSPSVLVALGEEEIALFPRGQSLPTFNADMLESVYSRGEIWRRVNRG